LSVTRIEIPEAFRELFEPKRYKVYYGGRGGSKSHNFARALLVKGMQQPLRILCARELQNSIGDSVHKLLSDLISQYNLTFYEVQKAVIRGANGTEFIFKGLKYNANEIKSTEGIDIAWVEEAEKVSDASWEMLVPTIRRDNSEIWISFNTKNITDPTYQRFVVNQSPDMLVRRVSWRDNPFFPAVLDAERKRLEVDDPTAYAHIWEGEPDLRRSGTIYAALIDQARNAGRITSVPHKPNIPVVTAWDLGKRHGTCIWFAQTVGREPRIIDYHEAYGGDADIDKLAEAVLSKEYLYGGHYTPHDGKHERLGMKGSINDQLRKAGLHIKDVPNLSIQAGIEKGKALIKEAYIDQTRCKNGLHALQHYHYEFDEARQCFKTDPFNDWSADASDAWRYIAIALDQRPSGHLGVVSQHKVLTSTSNVRRNKVKLGRIN
jgi:phage terminase large subunit